MKNFDSTTKDFNEGTIQGYVLVFGNLTNGVQSIHGPFKSPEQATQWASLNAHGQPAHVEPLRANTVD